MTYTGETLDLIAANDVAIERQSAIDAHNLVHGYLQDTYDHLLVFAREQGWQSDLVSHMHTTNWRVITERSMRVQLQARIEGEMAYRVTNGWAAAADIMQYVRIENREWAPTYVESESGLEPPSIHDITVGFKAGSPYQYEFPYWYTTEQIDSSTKQRWQELAELWNHLDEQSEERDWCGEYDRFCNEVDRAQQSADSPAGVWFEPERPERDIEVQVSIDVVVRVTTMMTVNRSTYDDGLVENEVDLDDDTVSYYAQNDLGLDAESRRAFYNAIQSSEVAEIEQY